MSVDLDALLHLQVDVAVEAAGLPANPDYADPARAQRFGLLVERYQNALMEHGADILLELVELRGRIAHAIERAGGGR